MNHPPIPPPKPNKPLFRVQQDHKQFLIEQSEGILVFVDIDILLRGKHHGYWRTIIAAVAAQEWRDIARLVFDESGKFSIDDPRAMDGMREAWKIEAIAKKWIEWRDRKASND